MYICIQQIKPAKPFRYFSSICCSGGGISSCPSHLLMKSPKASSFLPPARTPKVTHMDILSGTLSPVVEAA